jgi:tetratricopeptide (TPR) repeat protein
MLKLGNQLLLPLLRVVPLLLVAASVSAQPGGDLQAQIVYAYQTEAANQLQDLVQSLREQLKADGSNVALRYHLAHAEYRRGLLDAENRPRDAQSAFARCVDELKPVLEQDVKSVEALTLQSACYSELAKYRKLQAVILRSLATDRLDAALRLDPRNPRALYFKAMQGLQRAKPGSAQRQLAFEQLQLAAQLFEQSSSTRIDVPGWGQAEAYLALGAELESRHDLLGARNWIEKSLIVAPDCRAAQRQQALLLAH